ncbi:MAG: thioesterase [Ruminococcus sp.]|nr:thioesterase [Ruminococcus sp.]
MSKVKMYCLPYAGGSAVAYSDWADRYKSLVEVVPLEYNGHGTLFCEPFYKDAFEAAEDMCERICKDAPDKYIIYGHSMGSLIALLTAVKLAGRNNVQPAAVIVGGTRPPHLSYKDERISDLPKDKFIEKLVEFGQTDPELLEDPEFTDIIYDIMSNDTRICENFEADWDSLKINAPILAITGSQDDEAPLEDMKEWQRYTNGLFQIKVFEAGHFFAFECDQFPGYLQEKIAEFIK